MGSSPSIEQKLPLCLWSLTLFVGTEGQEVEKGLREEAPAVKG